MFKLRTLAKPQIVRNFQSEREPIFEVDLGFARMLWHIKYIEYDCIFGGKQFKLNYDEMMKDGNIQSGYDHSFLLWDRERENS